MILTLCIVILLVGGYVLWRNRRQKDSSITPDDAAKVEQGVYHPSWLAAHYEMVRGLGPIVSRFYRVTERNSPFSLRADAPDYDYTHVRLSDLVHRIVVVDSFPNQPNARGNMTRNPDGVRTMGLVRHTLTDLGHFKHEALHSLVWDRPELREQCRKYPGDHWPLIFRDYVGD